MLLYQRWNLSDAAEQVFLGSLYSTKVLVELKQYDDARTGGLPAKTCPLHPQTVSLAAGQLRKPDTLEQ